MSRKDLSFCWWNVNSFAHFEPSRAGEVQWPRSPDEYAAKCKRIDAALDAVRRSEHPHILAFAEITQRAALDLRDRLFPTYNVHSLDLYSSKPELQVSMLYDPSTGFVNENLFVFHDVPRGTRPVALIDFECDGHRIRFYACHWSARFSEESKNTRSDTARQLSVEIYKFMHEANDEQRHIVILGDLNEEPFGLVEERLFAHRFRERARAREHYSDESVSRVRLYNCSWRWLGERSPHSGDIMAGDTAGTYYWQKEKRWLTFDHVIVTGSLLSGSTPFVDETALRVFVCPEVLGHETTPQKFRLEQSEPRGLSDHLPICGRIVLHRGNLP
jgi:hypothetical protein